MNNQFASPIKVSVIIPAHNAAETITETLESLLAQTHHAWEAIVIDDGSLDETKAIATGFAEREHRIRVLFQAQGGVCAARNAGIAIARFDWLLFLDADDWLAPAYLEKMTTRLISDSRLDGVYCIAARISPEGKLYEEFLLPSGDLFHALARYAAFPIHTCVVRRSLVEAAGGFDTSLLACEDWDLWQRIVRTGARFDAVREVLAFYRMKPGSASVNAFQMFRDGLRVLKQGHSPDARVKNPHPAYANGLPSDHLQNQIFYFLSWCAGLLISYDNDARVLLDSVREYRYPELNPHGVAQNIYRATILPTGLTLSAWGKYWQKVEIRIREFLLALELQAQASGLAYRARTALERMIVEHPSASRPLTVGATHAIRIEVTEIIPDIFLSAKVERLYCTVEFDGSGMGTIELPVCDGLVPRSVLSDAIAAEFAWPILGRFFGRTIYPHLRIKRERTGFSIWREALRLTRTLCEDEHVIRQKMHEQIGWTVFLQEIWGQQNQPLDSFYTVGGKVSLKKNDWKLSFLKYYRRFFKTGSASWRAFNKGWMILDVSDKFHDMKVEGQEIHVVLTVGGVVLGTVNIPVKKNIIRTRELRAALTKASGFELCRASVREGLLGKSLADNMASLRDRLSAVKKSSVPHKEYDSLLRTCRDVAFVPGTDFTLDRVLSAGNYGVLFGRHLYGEIGTSASRRATLPSTVIPELIDASSTAGEPVIQALAPEGSSKRVLYVPELFWSPTRNMQISSPESRESETFQAKPSAFNSHDTDTTQALRRCSPPHYSGNKQNITTHQLPIIRYHRVAPDGLPSAVRYRVTPDAFAEQIRYLHDNGYYSIRLKDWHTAMEKKRPLPGKAVMITFDDGYFDFLTYAWPILRRYGFHATVFLVADYVGRSDSWDNVYGEEIPLLGWSEIRQLRDMGVEFGSHSASHPYLTALSPEKIVREGARSRAILGRELGITIRAFAYPYGDADHVVQHLIGACGYVYGLSAKQDLSKFQDPLLALPRIEITGSDKLQDFIEKLNVRPTQVVS